MRRYVVDASVAAQWLIPEPDSVKALVLIASGIERIVPDLLFAEIGNILWKRVRTGDLSRAKANEALEMLASIPLTVFPVAEIMDLTLEIATGYGRSFYDSTYLALALREQATLLTADGKLLRAMEHTPLGKTISGLNDLRDSFRQS